MKRAFFFLFLITIFATLLRFYNLGSVPNGFHKDEAFLGYNAYSILKTGRDMSGIFLPLHLKTFLYTPAGYSYFSIPFIYLFGLNEFSVRFISALFGVLAVGLTYFLSIEVYKSCKLNKIIKFSSETFGLITSFFLAVSPWNINLSRTASTITLVVFFIALGVYLFLKWCEKRRLPFFVLSLLSFELSLFFYISPYTFLPLLVILMFLIFDREIDKKNLILKTIFFSAIFIPVILSFLSPKISLRARSLSITNHSDTELVLNEKIREDGVVQMKPLITRFFHNKLIGYSSIFVGNYAAHFSYDFLFTDKGYPDRYRVPLMGLMYITDLILILLGTFILLKNFTWQRAFILIWIALAPIGSSMSQDDVPNLQRVLYIFPALSILSSIGLMSLIASARDHRISKLIFLGLALCFMYQFVFYLHEYYIHFKVYRPWYRNYGYKELVKETNTLLPKYKKAVITTMESSPAIFFLFYSNYSPERYLEETKNKNIKDYDRENFSSYEFSQEQCPLALKKVSISGKKGVLYVNSGLCRSDDGKFNLIKEINRPDNSAVFDILAI